MFTSSQEVGCANALTDTEMLRVTSTGTASEQRWTVCGQLTGPWVAELRGSWQDARRQSDGRKCVVDLSDVTFIDEAGEELLRAMKADGALFVARGVDTKHLLGNLKAKGTRPLRRFLTHPADCCGHPRKESERDRSSDEK